MCGVTAQAEEAVAAVASGGGFLVARCLFGGFDARVRWSLWGDWATCVQPFILFLVLFYFQKFILLHKSITLRRRLRPYRLKGKRGSLALETMSATLKFVDIFTKGLSSSVFRSSLNIYGG
jgi:hypothetical protein